MLEKAISDASLATENLFSFIHVYFLQPCTTEKNLMTSSRGPYFDEIKELTQALESLAGSLHSLQLHVKFALPRHAAKAAPAERYQRKMVTKMQRQRSISTVVLFQMKMPARNIPTSESTPLSYGQTNLRGFMTYYLHPPRRVFQLQQVANRRYLTGPSH